MDSITGERNKLYVRPECVRVLLDEALAISKEKKIELSLVLEAYKILEKRRRNDLYVSSGNIKDSFSERFLNDTGSIAQSIDSIANKPCE